MVQILTGASNADTDAHHSDASALTNNLSSSWESRPASNVSDGLLEPDLYHILN